MLSSWATFASFQSRLYCKIQGEQIVVLTKNEKGLYRCGAYLNHLNILLQKKSEELLLILQYEKETKDEDYRNDVYEIKKQEFSHLMRYKNSVVQALQAFEDSFFTQYQTLIVQILTGYLDELQQSIAQSEHAAPQTTRGITISKRTKQQIETVQKILDAQTLDEIIIQIPKYIYLKNQLEKWK